MSNFITHSFEHLFNVLLGRCQKRHKKWNRLSLLETAVLFALVIL